MSSNYFKVFMTPNYRYSSEAKMPEAIFSSHDYDPGEIHPRCSFRYLNPSVA
jgi:hypothetical protein